MFKSNAVQVQEFENVFMAGRYSLMVPYQKIPCGISSYKTIRTQHRYYIDKTYDLPLLEHAGDFLFLIRPRRFGKSSWLTVLESYYDLARQEERDLLFKGTFTYEHPTPKKHAYLILKFNFSQVDPRPENFEASFHRHAKTCFHFFGEKYRAWFGDDYFELIRERQDE
ncbi:hypothetical protein U27_00041 [Candidatus Vecturithrix granuli]|uniref:AAA-ATPase-like domain-containing protein n=1 Tax=Vecturithrix granuli TaxID=1499967 RepID=A0A081C6E5_VECG1|nr:hypothetical protein U27_00041 [Candidatus Vecturithrix granuli]